MTVCDVEQALAQIAPPSLKIGHDPIGRSVGSQYTQVTGIAVALDATVCVMDAAIGAQCNVIITHHPLIYTPLASLDLDVGFPQTAAVYAVKHGLTIISAHTNWDCAHGGINDTLASLLHIVDTEPIEDIRIFGTTVTGLGRIGRLETPMPETAYMQLVDAVLGIHTRRSEERVRLITSVALCGGAGASLYPAIKQKADLFMTGDVRHHEFVMAYGEGCTIWDIGHRESESPGTKELGSRLADGLLCDVTWIDALGRTSKINVD